MNFLSWPCPYYVELPSQMKTKIIVVDENEHQTGAAAMIRGTPALNRSLNGWCDLCLCVSSGNFTGYSWLVFIKNADINVSETVVVAVLRDTSRRTAVGGRGSAVYVRLCAKSHMREETIRAILMKLCSPIDTDIAIIRTNLRNDRSRSVAWRRNLPFPACVSGRPYNSLALRESSLLSPLLLSTKKQINSCKNYLLQFISSDQSPQLCLPSQTHVPEIQRPVILHWNWSSEHAIHRHTKNIHYVWFETKIVNLALDRLSDTSLRYTFCHFVL